MNWVDFAIFGLFVAVVMLEVKRGFGRALFDFAALLIALKAASLLGEPVSHTFQFTASTSTNLAVIYLGLFVILGALLAFLGKFLYDTTLISAEAFDALLGGLFGLGIAVILCHALVRTVALNAGAPDIPPAVVAQSAFGTEFLTFESYHRLLNFLYNFHHVD